MACIQLALPWLLMGAGVVHDIELVADNRGDCLYQQEKDTTLFDVHVKESQTKQTETKNEKVEGVPYEYQRLFE